VRAKEIDEWAEWMQARGMSENTILARIRRVELFAQMANPVHATSEDVVTYMASLPKLSTGTRATYYSHLRAWFAWLITTEKRVDDPTKRLPAPRTPRREPRPVTEGQLQLILAVRMRTRTRMMVYLALFQGLRAHEIAKFKGEDIDMTARQITVLGKGGVERTLPLHDLVGTFAEVFPRRGYWFPSPEDPRGHIRSRSVSDIVGDVLRRAGIPKGAAHRLRHTYATRLVQNGENLRVVQELLRHASLQTTQIYTGVTFDQQRDALGRLGLPKPAPDAA